MALMRMLGNREQGKRKTLAQEIGPAVAEIIGLDPSDRSQYSHEAPRDGDYGGVFDYYGHLICDPTPARVTKGQEMAEAILAKMVENANGASPRIGVYLDIGSHRFWTQT